jgi:Transposase DDE domain group 1
MTVELLRPGATASVLGHRVMAASTVGTFLRSFTFGHARQLDQVTATILQRAWAADAGPGDGPLTIDVDSAICDVHSYHKQGACYGYTHRLGYHPLLATRADSGEVLHARLRKGAATPLAGSFGSLTSWWPGSAAPAPAASSPSGWTRDSGRPSSSGGSAATGCATRSWRARLSLNPRAP